MGIDAIVYAPGHLIDGGDALARLLPGDTFKEARIWSADAISPIEVVEWQSLQRLWSPDYPRGYWPTIRDAIVALREVYGVAHYCGDNYYHLPPPFTLGEQAEYDAAWAQRGWAQRGADQ